MPDLNGAFQWAIETCNMANVCYSQQYRNAQTVGDVTYYDCSSFINFAINAGGFETPNYAPKNNAFTTLSMPTELERLGWTNIALNNIWLAGDIVLSSSHTEMVYEGTGEGTGYTMGAHQHYSANPDLDVSINDYISYASTYSTLWRYGDGGAIEVGCSFYVIAAILGTWCVESGLNPAVWESTATEKSWTAIGEGYGLAQWTNVGTSYGRLYQLYVWMTERGYSMTDGNGQISYFLEGLDWQPNQYNDYISFENFMSTTETNLYTLVVWFATGYELGESYDESYFQMAYNYAIEIHDYIIEHINDDVDWIYRDGSLSWDETLNNAVVIAKYLHYNYTIPDSTYKKKSIALKCLRHPRTYPRR